EPDEGGEKGKEAAEENHDEAEAAQKKKKKRKTGAAEDKAEAEEQQAEELEQEQEQAEDAGDLSQDSGMYSTEGEGEDEPDEAELAGAEAKGEMKEDVDDVQADSQRKDGYDKCSAMQIVVEDDDQKEKDEGDEDEGKDEEEKDDEDEGEEDSEEPEKGDTGGTAMKLEAEEADDEDGGSGGKQKKPQKKTKLMKDKTPVALKSSATAATVSGDHLEARKQAEQDLREALNSGQMLWSSPLRGNTLSLIVSHQHSQCAHSLFVGEVLRGILESSELQDPACAGVKDVHVKIDGEQVALECEGINLFALQALPATLVNHCKIYTNDIRKVLGLYGVEAARASVVQEVKNVFGHYGIQVNHRHLALIADYMAQGGDLRAFNRLGMIHCPSPLLQMSYETTMQFLSTACQEGLLDNMTSPASAIVLGKPPEVGTGMVNLLVDLDPPEPPWKKQRKFDF
ncbi:unnamed protein product, partial [Effrenium voratum]